MAGTDIARLLRHQIIDLWGGGDLDLVDRLYAEHVVDHMPIPGQPGGRDAMKDVVRLFRAAIPDLTMNLHGTIVSADTGVDFWTLTGTHAGDLFGLAATGRAVRFSGIDMVRAHDDRITDIWHVEEMWQFQSQIGGGEPAFGTVIGDAPVTVDASATYDPGRHACAPDPAALGPVERRNLQITRDHVERIWARGDADLAWQIYAPDVVDHTAAPDQRMGIAGIVDMLTGWHDAVPDLRMEIAQHVVQGDLAADRWVMRGTHSGAPLMGHPARGRSFEINGMDVIRIRPDGLIRDVWHVEELARLRDQIAG